MTCSGCADHIKQALEGLPEVENAMVYLQTNQATVALKNEVTIEVFQVAVGSKYTVSEQVISPTQEVHNSAQGSKLRQLRPLLIIFICLLISTVLLNYESWDNQKAMLDFMGLFFLVFGFFKLLDLKGFPASFAMYDPMAAKSRIYGWVYPFIELALGSLLLLRIAIVPALILTVLLLATTTVGIVSTLRGKRKIRCACLGTWLKLPMTEATLIENSLMIIMAIVMLLQIFGS